jgi:hypothetical protein
MEKFKVHAIHPTNKEHGLSGELFVIESHIPTKPEEIRIVSTAPTASFLYFSLSLGFNGARSLGSSWAF